MASDETSRFKRRRRFSHAALVCFSIAGISFVACALGFFVNQALTGSLAISGTAAVGLIYLAMGLLNLGHDTDSVEVIVRTRSVTHERVDPPASELRPGTEPPTEAHGIPDHQPTLSS